ncbi:MAG: hypothetical protein LBP53_04560 [Candidatus Peribacteria bacterium]|jgi:hypothetical protein|nr:hypothetical protein [Candidatus Peribacteria bacterium]
MNAFISKYSKLAVKVNSTTLGTVANGVSVKKVPGKNIYFVDGNLKIEGTNTVYNKPFTIIQTIGDTTIKGNLHHNMMLLTNGKITFDGSASCTATQTLKGIYYAKGGFYSINVSFNNNLNNPSRCTKGNLHIKGIAIGDGLINNVMANRRSELNQWFTCKSPTTQCQTQRRNYIMNGAALLIEYSPSIFTTATMPPGAEEFTKALEVYKT